MKRNSTRHNIAIGLLSASIIAYQLIILQLFEFTQWYHFAYLIVSIAMLGFGASGAFIALFRKTIQKQLAFILPSFSMLSGLLMTLVFVFSQFSFIRFDTYLFFTSYDQVFRLIVVSILFFLPFFFGASVLGIFFSFYPKQIGQLYFANMLGSGAGGLILPLMAFHFYPEQSVIVNSFIAVLAGIMLIPPAKRRSLSILSVLSILCLWYFIIFPAKLHVSQFKSLSKAMDLPDAGIIAQKPGPDGIMHQVRSALLRYAPSLSLTYNQQIPSSDVVFINGNWNGALFNNDGDNAAKVLNYSSANLPFVLQQPKNALIISAGAGEYMVHAALKDLQHIDATETNRNLVEVLEDLKKDFADKDKQITIVPENARTFVADNPVQYDLIILPNVNSFGGNSGIDAIKEDYLFTTEAIADYFSALSDNGMMSVTCWLDYPSRYALKLLSTVYESLKMANISQPEKHLLAVKSWGTITFGVSKSEITKRQIEKTKDFCEHMKFDPFLYPGITENETKMYHQLQDTALFLHFQQIVKGEASFFKKYLFNVQPSSDDKPFFNQFLRLKNLDYLREKVGNVNFPYIEVATVFLYLTFVLVIMLALVFILIPLLKLRVKPKVGFEHFLYFSGIGMGYMFIEMVLIQKSILYFDVPLYATAIVLCLMLVFSGFGSAFSSRLKLNRSNILQIILLIVALLILLSFTNAVLLKLMMGLSLTLKLFMFSLVILPVAFLMGMPFPMGIRRLQLQQEQAIPWAWGINACFSVISSVLATILALHMGFTNVFLLAAAAYFISLLPTFIRK